MSSTVLPVHDGAVLIRVFNTMTERLLASMLDEIVATRHPADSRKLYRTSNSDSDSDRDRQLGLVQLREICRH